MISDVYFPRINGVSTSIQVFRRELEALGCQVTLIAPDYGDSEQDDIDIIRIPSRKVLVDPEDRMMKWGSVMRQLPRLRRREFDLVHIQTPFVAHYVGVKLARLLGVPVVETYHTYFEEYLYNYVSYLPRSLLRFAARRFTSSQCNSVDSVIVPSSPIKEAMTRYGVRTETRIIPTGIELNRFKGGDGLRFRRHHGIDKDRPVLVHVGRVAHEKNIDFLLDVVERVRREIPDVLMIIAGEGPARKHLIKRARHMGLEKQVLFVGYLNREAELLDCYRAGNLFVFSSRTETQGLVLLESMALGVPVVSTAILGTRDVLREGRGALIAEDDVEKFAERVVLTLNDSGLRQNLSIKALEYVHEWRAQAFAERMLSHYHRMLKLPLGESLVEQETSPTGS